MFEKFFKKAIVKTVTVAFETFEKAEKEYEKAKPKIEKVKKDITPIIESTIDFTKSVIDEVMDTEIIKSIRNELKAISKRRLEQYEKERKERLETLKSEIDAEIGRDIELVFLDVEADKTGRRVREVSAIKVLMNFKNKTLKEIDRFEKFYDDTREIHFIKSEDGKYGEDYDVEYEDEEEFERDGDNLSEEDKEEFYYFAKDAEMMVSHNVKYDMKFFDKLNDKKRFCTMTSNVSMTKLEFEYAGNTFYKFPKLKEAAEFYNITFNQNMLHTSMYDTYLCMKVFEKMMINNEAQKDILYHLLDPDLNFEKVYQEIIEE